MIFDFILNCRLLTIFFYDFAAEKGYNQALCMIFTAIYMKLFLILTVKK